MVTVSYSDDTFGYHITGHSWMVTVSYSDDTFGYHITGHSWMVTVSYSDDTFGYHITGHSSLSRTMITAPSGPHGFLYPLLRFMQT